MTITPETYLTKNSDLPRKKLGIYVAKQLNYIVNTDMSIKDRTDNQRTAEYSYNIDIDTALPDGELTPDEIVQRMEIDHVVKSLPPFKKILSEGGGDSVVTYISGRTEALTKYTSKPKLISERETMTEDSAFKMTADFFEHIREKLSEIYEGNERDRLLLNLDEFLEGTSFISSKEYDEATKGIAEYWKALLTHNPNQQIWAVTGEAAKEDIDKTTDKKPVKSDEYLLDNILKHFSDDDIKKYKERLIFDESDITATEAENIRIVFLDDWTVTGEQLSKVVHDIQTRFPQLTSSMEIQLITAPATWINYGFAFRKKTDEGPAVRSTLPLRAYYKARHARTRTGARISGTHSSVDYGFESDIEHFYFKAHSTARFHPESAEGYFMPPLTNIVRPYRMQSFELTQKKRAQKLGAE